MHLHPDWLIPDWPLPTGVRAVFTTRAGGTSGAPWDSFNLGEHVGDVAQHVAGNRALLRESTGAHAVFLQQVHGAHTAHVTASTPDGQLADASVATQAGVACTVMVADCLPVLLASPRGGVVAAAHAGWRGLAGGVATGQAAGEGGVLESVAQQFLANSARADVFHTCSASETLAWLGPCIGPIAFEVGAEVKAIFEACQPGSSNCFKPAGGAKYLADLAGLARLRLNCLGITQIYGNDGSPAWCTASNPSRFFSHRRDTAAGFGGIDQNGSRLCSTGRMAASIWLL